MKRKISGILLILSLTLIFLGYRSMRETLLISRGNSLSLKERYIEADKVFKEAAVRYSSKTAQRNRGVNLYNGEEYEKLIESGRGEKFLRGNAHAYLGEQNPKKMKEHYESALEEYRKAMKGSGDINIKKNYEIVSRRLEDMKNKKEKQQENKKDQKQNKDQQEQDKRNNDQKQQQKEQQQEDSGKDKQENSQENKKQNKGSEDQNQEQGKQDRGENTSGSSNKPDSDPEKGQLQRGEAPEETTQRREALTILERLEGSEEQAFKNNERLERIGGEEAHEAW